MSERSSGKRRSSRSRTSATRRAPLGGRLAGAGVGRAILYAMIALTVAHVAFTAYQLREATRSYADVPIGIGRAEARYILGAPATSGDDWTYRSGSAVTRLSFAGPDGGVAAVECRDDRLEGACPPTARAATGEFEDRIWYRHGAPDDYRYEGDTKVIAYRDLGLSFGLRKFQATSIRLERPAGSWLVRLPRVLMP